MENTTKNVTRGSKAREDIAYLLRSKHTLLWVTTSEETRAEKDLAAAAESASYVTYFWDCVSGITGPDGTEVKAPPGETLRDPVAAVRWLEQTVTGRAMLLMRDVHQWLKDATMLRALRNAHRRMTSLPRSTARAMALVLPPDAELPSDLRSNVTVFDWPLPDREEIGELLRSVADRLETKPSEDAIEQTIDASVGLSAEEAQNCYALSIVRKKTIDPTLVAREKKRVISRIQGLSWYDPDPRGLDAVGGLDELKGWLSQRKNAFSARARAYGLPAPRGCMIVGIPGTGKSLTAKALATSWNVPLIRFDLGAMRSKYVGDSEANVRRAIQILESVGQCVLWLDEIEKALAGTTGAQGDGGVAADALGTILSWMQERTCPVFVVATANDVSQLPPELLRKGRFDEVWWVDLPTTKERRAILRSALSAHGRTIDSLDNAVEATNEFVGAEIAALVPDAMFAAFAEGERALTEQDIVDAARRTTPLARTAKEKIQGLRTWATGRARNAGSMEAGASQTGPETRDLDF